MTEYDNTKAGELADFCVKIAEEKFAEDVCKLHVTGKTTIADYFVICTVNSEPQLRALCSHLERAVRETYHLRNLSHDAQPTSGWLLQDFGDVLVHVMTPEMRDRYCLESLWGGSPDENAVKQIEKMSER